MRKPTMKRSSQSRRPNRRAFTLVEMLVTIAVMGIMASLILPAVVALRNTTRQARCEHNMVQLGLALQSYEAAHLYFPPGTINRGGPVPATPTGYHHNWLIHVLPYLDEENAFRAIDQTVNVYHAKNAAVRQHYVPSLFCPARTFGEANIRGEYLSSYAAVHHDVEAPIDANNNGVFFLNSRLRREDIKDGLSHTAFVGEKLNDRSDLGWMSGTRATLRNMGTPLNETVVGKGGNVAMFGYGPNEFDNIPLIEAQDKADFGPKGDINKASDTFEQDEDEIDEGMMGEIDDCTQDGTQGDGNVQKKTPAGRQTRPGKPVRKPLAVGGFGSKHRNGGLFLFGDGSVHFITPQIDGGVYQRFGHRADGQLPGRRR